MQGDEVKTKLVLAMSWMIAVGSARLVHAEGQDQSAPVFKYMQKSFAEYDMVLGTNAKSKLTFKSKPLYRWTVLISGRNDGSLFLWLKDGRPEVAGCVITRPSARLIYHEFHSLSQQPVTATWRSRKIWYPRMPGLRMGIDGVKKAEYGRHLCHALF